jgi:hypothetical protein
MYRNRYSFAAVGPRTHEDGLPDVAAVMHREVADPRGWSGRDPEQGDEELEEDPAFRSGFRRRMRPGPRNGAAGCGP